MANPLKTKTLYVPLQLDWAKQLERLAEKEHRSTGQQAALMIIKALKEETNHER